MPRTITETRTVFKFEELDERAQQRALDTIAGKLVGDWWDQHDNDDIAATMVYTFAEKLRAPGCDKYGVGDFPGIAGVKLEEWDLDRGQTIKFKGHLDRDNAPGLPWAEGIEAVVLTAYRWENNLHVETDWEVPETDEEATRVSALVEAMRDAVEDALHTAWRAGRDEMEYKGGEEYARDWVEANEPEFDEDGDLDR